MSGKTRGPALVQQLAGSTQAKQRLQAILETISGRLTVKDACRQLGIAEAMFHRLRNRVLEAGLADLEPRPRGRPRRAVSQHEGHLTELQQRVAHLEDELQLAEVRLELARVLPRVVHEEPDAVKKTTCNSLGRKPKNQRTKKRQPRKNRPR